MLRRIMVTFKFSCSRHRARFRGQWLWAEERVWWGGGEQNVSVGELQARDEGRDYGRCIGLV